MYRLKGLEKFYLKIMFPKTLAQTITTKNLKLSLKFGMCQ